MTDHNPIAFQFTVLDKREGVAVHVNEHDQEGRLVEGGIHERLTGGGSVTGDIGGGNYLKIEAE